MIPEVPSKLKIAIVLDRFLPSRGGENYFSWLAMELTRRGHEVHVFAAQTEGALEDDYQIHLIPVWRFSRSLRIISFLLNSARAVRPYRFDIIHGVGWTLAMNVFNPHGGVEKAYLKQDFLSITNRLYSLLKYVKRYLSLQHYLIAWIQRRQYLNDKVKKIIAISHMVKRDIIHSYGVPEGKIAVVLNCVDLDRFHPRNLEIYREPGRTALGIHPDTLLLIFAGNNYRLKGVEPLLAAMGLLRKWFSKKSFRLMIVGRGQIRRYRRKAGRLGVSDLTLFLGPIRNIEQVYAMGDIYVHPTYYDSCSLTVLEALASGLPVITSQHNGAAEAILSEEGGIVVDDPGDVERLARAIASFFDEDRRKRARVITREWMMKYSPTYNVEETLRVYAEVAETK